MRYKVRGFKSSQAIQKILELVVSTQLAGYGKAIAELLTYGETEWSDPYTMDVNRFAPGSNNKFLIEKTAPVTLFSSYELMYPGYDHEKSSRNIKTETVIQKLAVYPEEVALATSVSNWGEIKHTLGLKNTVHPWRLSQITNIVNGKKRFSC